MKTFAKLKCTQSPHRFVLRDQNLTLILKTGSCTLNLEWNVECPPSQHIHITKICINYIRSNNNINTCENWFLFLLYTYFFIVFNFVSWSSKPKLVTLRLSAEKLHWQLPKKTSQHFQLLPPSLPAFSSRTLIPFITQPWLWSFLAKSPSPMSPTVYLL